MVSYNAMSEVSNQKVIEWMYFGSGSVCNIYYGHWRRNYGSSQVDCLEFMFFL